jgi:hypothetical protein
MKDHFLTCEEMKKWQKKRSAHLLWTFKCKRFTLSLHAFHITFSTSEALWVVTTCCGGSCDASWLCRKGLLVVTGMLQSKVIQSSPLQSCNKTDIRIRSGKLKHTRTMWTSQNVSSKEKIVSLVSSAQRACLRMLWSKWRWYVVPIFLHSRTNSDNPGQSLFLHVSAISYDQSAKCACVV